eukprot:TRINITY_DN1788_c0_g1_i1.p4 TRINITY_DN1788_c0_g1~~TRINITY_DN1788_c0_g1_i1.p4  ORF type:complete len:53 (-),score=1.18 TRINITY_DN1788_c0_g1_i1:81-239(-)
MKSPKGKDGARSGTSVRWRSAFRPTITLARFDPPWTPYFMRRNEVVAKINYS